MTPVRILLYLIFCLGFLSSCVPVALTSHVAPTEIGDMQKFETFSYIALIEGGNRGKINDTLSKQSKAIFNEALAEFTSIPVTGTITVTDTSTKNRIEEAVAYLFLSARKQQSIEALVIPSVLDSLLELNGKRFGLLTMTTGFTRVKGNYAGQIAKGVAMGILTLGTFYQTPIKSNSTVYIMIVDAQDNNVAFFNDFSLQDKDPLNKAILTKQIQKLFNGYFWSSP